MKRGDERETEKPKRRKTEPKMKMGKGGRWREKGGERFPVYNNNNLINY